MHSSLPIPVLLELGSSPFKGNFPFKVDVSSTLLHYCPRNYLGARRNQKKNSIIVSGCSKRTWKERLNMIVLIARHECRFVTRKDEKDSLIVTVESVVSLRFHFLTLLTFSFSILEMLNWAAEISPWSTMFKKGLDFLPILLKIRSHILAHTKIIILDWRQLRTQTYIKVIKFYDFLF